MENECKMHSDDDKALCENKKRMVKSPFQLENLEKLFSEHKYPTESMKAEVASKIHLTEKQVSEWFCHRRTKEKRRANKESPALPKQDKSSVVIQDHCSDHRQDSCGSTKQLNNRNLDTREVESQWVTLHEYTLVLGNDNGGSIETHDTINDVSSGSNSSSRNMTNHIQGRLFGVESSKLPTDTTTGLKSPGRGPAGYLKLKGPVENAAVTEVKRQLKKRYRDDGPPLSVEFDMLPPGAFEPLMRRSYARETCYNGQPMPPASPYFPKLHQYPNSGEGRGYNFKVADHNPYIYGTSFDAPPVPDIRDGYIHQRCKKNASFPNNGAYYPQRESFGKFPAVFPRDISVTGGKDGYGMKYRNGDPAIQMGSFSGSCHLGPFDGNLPKKGYERNFFGNGSANLTGKRFVNHHSYDHMQPRRIPEMEGRKTYADMRIEIENQSRIPYKNDLNNLKRIGDNFRQQPHFKRSSMMDFQSRTYQVARFPNGIPTGSREGETSAETSSSVS